MRLRLFALLSVLLLPAPALALPLVVGFGDSITSRTFDQDFDPDSYLDWLGPDYLVDDVAEPARRSEGVLAAAEAWLLAGNTADLVIVMSGTPDAAREAFGETYDLDYTVSNISSILTLFANAGIDTILMAPPPVIDPCGVADPTCATMDERVADMAIAFSALAASASVPFLDVYDLFRDYDDITGLFPEDDGIHPSIAGDQLIAWGLQPLIGQILPIPEPTTVVLLGFGLTGLTVAGRRRAAC